MAVNILLRPQAYLIGETLNVNLFECFVDERLGRADVSKSDRSDHNLFNGSIIYFKSPVGEYNGLWTVEVFDTNEFYIQPYSGNEYVQFIRRIGTSTLGDVQAGTAFYSNTQHHRWHCVHLPIVYKLSNTLWPVNTVDTVRVISSVTDSNGYCALSLSGDIKTTGSAVVLDAVIVSNANDSSYNGVYQIRAYTNDTTFVIDLGYSLLGSDAALSGASIQFYYNNYITKVQIWGGLNNAHEYYGQKPYELLATLDLIPDEDGICMFSVSEILKKQIELKNNLLLGTLPNNLDAWTGFFIKYGEEYDTSDGTELTRSTVTYTSDLANFEGKAVNSMLPFKNVYSGAMSEYASANSNQKFLTNFDNPVIFQDKYFDIGFIWEGVTTFFFKKEWYLNNVLQLTESSEALEAFYTGVYRYPFEAICTYDRLDITAYKTTGIPPPSAWSNSSFASAFDFKTATQLIEIVGLGTSQQGAYTSLSASNGDTVTINLIVEVSGVWSGTLLSISALLTNNSDTSVNSVASPDITTNGTYNFELTIPVTVSSPVVERLHIVLTSLNILTGGPAVNITVPNHVRISSVSNAISETKTIDIDCACVPTDAEEGIYLSWLNNLGHFGYWFFTANKDHIIDITETGETEENTFPEWPNSYGEFADTILKETYRNSRKQVLVRSQNLTASQLEGIKAIKSSPLVQIVNSIYDRRTVIVDADSFTWKKEGQAKTDPYKISFTITYTDDLPSQKA